MNQLLRRENQSFQFPSLEKMLDEGRIAPIGERFQAMASVLDELQNHSDDPDARSRAKVALAGLEEAVRIIQELVDIQGFLGSIRRS